MILKLVVVCFVSVWLFACGDQRELGNKALLPEAESAGGILYKEFCSACHAPPRIASHKANEWLNIVIRMQTHRIKKAYHPLSESEQSVLVAYLKKHSAN